MRTAARMHAKNGHALTYEALLERLAAEYADTWTFLDEIKKLPLKQRSSFYDQAVGRMACEKSSVTRDMLAKRAAEVFTGVPPSKIRHDLAGLLPVSADDHRLAITDVEPWDSAIEDGSALLDEIAKVFTTYIALPDHGADALALWSVFTHAIDVFDIAPILALSSPEKRCGKTTALEIAAQLVRRSITASNVTSATIFRVVERFKPTLLLDEADTWLASRRNGSNDDLRGIVNCGHTRATAFVMRTVGDDHEPRRFCTYCPKLIAFIGKMPSTIEDRSIALPMRRKRSDEHVAKLRRDRLGAFEPLRRKIARWVSDHLADFEMRDAAVPEELDDRAADNWRALVTIADVAGGGWPVRARAAAVALSGASARADDSRGVELLSDIRRCFTEKMTERMTDRRGTETTSERLWTDDLIAWLIKDPERLWATWDHGRPITAKHVAALLRPYGIRSGSIRIGAKTAKGYEREDFTDAWRRYLPPQPSQPSQVNNGTDLDPHCDPSHAPGVPGARCGINKRKDGVVTGVTGETGLGSSRQGAHRLQRAALLPETAP